MTIADLATLTARGFEHVEKRFHGVEKDIKDIKTDVKELKTDVSGLKTDVKGLKKDVSCLQTDMAIVKLDIKDIRTVQEEHSKKLDRHTDMHESTAGMLKMLDEERYFTINHVNRLEGEINQIKKRLKLA